MTEKRDLCFLLLYEGGKTVLGISHCYKVPPAQVRSTLEGLGAIEEEGLTKEKIIDLMGVFGSTSKVAKSLGVSGWQFVRQARPLLGGLTPQEAFLKARQAEALRQFKRTRSVMKAAAEMGLDRNTITNLIKKATGKTPRALLSQWANE